MQKSTMEEKDTTRKMMKKKQPASKAEGEHARKKSSLREKAAVSG